MLQQLFRIRQLCRQKQLLLRNLFDSYLLNIDFLWLQKHRKVERADTHFRRRTKMSFLATWKQYTLHQKVKKASNNLAEMFREKRVVKMAFLCWGSAMYHFTEWRCKNWSPKITVDLHRSFFHYKSPFLSRTRVRPDFKNWKFFTFFFELWQAKQASRCWRLHILAVAHKTHNFQKLEDFRTTEITEKKAIYGMSSVVLLCTLLCYVVCHWFVAVRIVCGVFSPHFFLQEKLNSIFLRSVFAKWKKYIQIHKNKKVLRVLSGSFRAQVLLRKVFSGSNLRSYNWPKFSCDLRITLSCIFLVAIVRFWCLGY